MIRIVLAAGLALVLGMPALAQSVPRLDLNPVCRPPRSESSIRIDTERCLKTEHDARAQLAREWTTFPAADRSLCIQTATITSIQSYVDLLTCLEMRRDVAKLPADRGLRSAPAGMNTKP